MDGVPEGRARPESQTRQEPSSRLDEMAPPAGVRLPRQPRSRVSFERMITAAQDLIGESGLEGATVQGDPPALRGRLGDILCALRRKGRATRVPG